MQVPAIDGLHGQVATVLPFRIAEPVAEVAAHARHARYALVGGQSGPQPQALVSVVAQHAGELQVHRAHRQPAGGEGLEPLHLAVQVQRVADAVDHRVGLQVAPVQAVHAPLLPVRIIPPQLHAVGHQLRAAHLAPFHLHAHLCVLQVRAAHPHHAQSVHRGPVEIDEAVQLAREPVAIDAFMQLLEAHAHPFALGGFGRDVLHGIAIGVDVQQPLQTVEACVRPGLVADHVHAVRTLVQRVLQNEPVLRRARRPQRSQVALLADPDVRVVNAEALRLRRHGEQGGVAQSAHAHGQHLLAGTRRWDEVLARGALDQQQVLGLGEVIGLARAGVHPGHPGTVVHDGAVQLQIEDGLAVAGVAVAPLTQSIVLPAVGVSTSDDAVRRVVRRVHHHGPQFGVALAQAQEQGAVAVHLALEGLVAHVAQPDGGRQGGHLQPEAAIDVAHCAARRARTVHRNESEGFAGTVVHYTAGDQDLGLTDEGGEHQ